MGTDEVIVQKLDRPGEYGGVFARPMRQPRIVGARLENGRLVVTLADDADGIVPMRITPDNER
jgi:hypothetical protein